jgi:hypothetical protein
LGKHYDSVFVIGALELVPAIVANPFVEGTILTATAGKTQLTNLVDSAKALRESGRRLFGVVLWDAPPPHLSERPKRKAGGKRKAPPSRMATPHPAVS